MSSYLWDRSGAPDGEIEHLEKLLAPMRYRGARLPVERRWRPQYLAIAASVVLMIAGWQLLRSGGPTVSKPTSWTVAEVEGSVRLGRAAAVASGRLRTGESLITGDSSQAALEAEDFGRVEVRPGSEVRVIESAAGHQRMDLRQGAIHALIWAPPRQFVVDTPSARAVDLGCQYDLSVDSRGNGLVTVETGWVAFEYHGLESFIPAGAACRTTRARGPGTPFFTDSSAEFRNALARYEASSNNLDAVLLEARQRDGLTLWHLLQRVPAADRGRVFDRFTQLVAVPNEVQRVHAIALDRGTLDRCWNALNLDDASWWREWKRDWRN
jgi:hypothetical protein